MVSFYLVALLLALMTAFSEGEKPGKPRWEPLPPCQDCVSPDSIVAPGVGFDLTPSYGTAAVRFHDGSVVVVGKLNGDEGYKSLMKRLSAGSSRPPKGQPQFDSIWDELKHLLERAKREMNKRRGFPATADVGIIGFLLKQLRLECEKKLGHSITAAVAAMPKLPGMTTEDLADAMEYAGLTTLKSYNYFGDVSETSAAFAGTGYGLCSNPRDLDTCEDEEAMMPLQRVLAVGLTDSCFTVTYTRLRHAHSSHEFKTTLDYDLGLGALDSHPDDSSYWDRIRTAINNIAAVASEPLDTLLLLGEDGANEKLLDVIHNALGNLQPLPMNSTNIHPYAFPDPLYVAARGAAEFAKRFQEMPWHCKEPARCFEDVRLVNQENRGRRGYKKRDELK